MHGDHDVRRLEVAMDDSLLVRVLDRVADLNEQLQPFSHAHAILVAVVGDLDPIDQLHDEVRSAGFGGSGIEDLCDVGMVHQGQRLALGLEPGDHVPGIHARA
jgi:hypothetical protein